MVLLNRLDAALAVASPSAPSAPSALFYIENPDECAHDWITNMIQMPDGYMKPGRTLCARCGAVHPQQWSEA